MQIVSFSPRLCCDMLLEKDTLFQQRAALEWLRSLSELAAYPSWCLTATPQGHTHRVATLGRGTKGT